MLGGGLVPEARCSPVQSAPGVRTHKLTCLCPAAPRYCAQAPPATAMPSHPPGPLITPVISAPPVHHALAPQPMQPPTAELVFLALQQPPPGPQMLDEKSQKQEGTQGQDPEQNWPS